MKRFLPLLLLVAELPSWGAVAVDTTTTKASASCPAVTTAIDTTGAAMLFVVVSNYGSNMSAITVSDSVGGNSNTWTLRAGIVSGSPSAPVGIFTAAATYTGSGHTFTVTGCAYVAIVAGVITGTAASPVDQTRTGEVISATAVQANSGGGNGVTPTENSELVLAAEGDTDAANATADGGFVSVQHIPGVSNLNNGLHVAALVQTTAAFANPTWTGTANTARAAVLVTFKAASGGGANVRRRVVISQ